MTDLKHSPYLGRRLRSEAEVAQERRKRKKPCKMCGGAGFGIQFGPRNTAETFDCPACHGTGKRRAE